MRRLTVIEQESPIDDASLVADCVSMARLFWMCENSTVYATPIVVRCDATAALGIVRLRAFPKMKHLEVRIFAIQDWVATNRLRTVKVVMSLNVAGHLTKHVPKARLERNDLSYEYVQQPFDEVRWEGMQQSHS